MLTTFQWILLVTVINGLIALLGAIIFLSLSKKSHKVLIYFVSFTTGALLGGALLHFIPEAVEELSLVKTTILTLAGFVIFFLLETYLHWHHCHNHECNEHHNHSKEKPYTHLLIYGDSVHNFIDGVIIAGSFIISIPRHLEFTSIRRTSRPQRKNPAKDALRLFPARNHVGSTTSHRCKSRKCFSDFSRSPKKRQSMLNLTRSEVFAMEE